MGWIQLQPGMPSQVSKGIRSRSKALGSLQCYSRLPGGAASTG
jgi:hypothetical protein